MKMYFLDTVNIKSKLDIRIEKIYQWTSTEFRNNANTYVGKSRFTVVSM